MNLTPHFTLEELTATSHREFDNTPNADEVKSWIIGKSRDHMKTGTNA